MSRETYKGRRGSSKAIAHVREKSFTSRIPQEHIFQRNGNYEDIIRKCLIKVRLHRVSPVKGHSSFYLKQQQKYFHSKSYKLKFTFRVNVESFVCFYSNVPL